MCKDILHGEEVEPWEALPPALQVLEQGAAADLQVVVHLLQEWQDPWREKMLNEYISYAKQVWRNQPQENITNIPFFFYMIIIIISDIYIAQFLYNWYALHHHWHIITPALAELPMDAHKHYKE